MTFSDQFSFFSLEDTPTELWPNDEESVRHIKADWAGDNGDKR